MPPHPLTIQHVHRHRAEDGSKGDASMETLGNDAIIIHPSSTFVTGGLDGWLGEEAIELSDPS
eukprot:3086734-Pyramimonas_sp.AAC.1